MDPRPKTRHPKRNNPRPYRCFVKSFRSEQNTVPQDLQPHIQILSFVVQPLLRDGLTTLRKLEELNLDIYNGDDSWSWLKAGLDFNKDNESLKLPHRVFYCKTLVVLKLHGKIRIDVPSSSSFQFPSLKELGLFHLVYKSDSLFRLLSACHVLEDLTFGREYRDGVFDYKICIPMLKRLSVDFEVGEYIGYELIPYDDYKLEMKTPALEYFKFNGHLREVVFLQKLDNLLQADVNICTFEEKDHRQEEQCYADRVFKILAALYNVKFLSFYSGHSEVRLLWLLFFFK